MPDISERKQIHSVPSTAVPQPEVVLGVIIGIDVSGSPMVDWQNNPADAPVAALSTTIFTAADLSRSVALLFADGDPGRPIILGIIRQPLDDVITATHIREAEDRPEPADGAAQLAGDHRRRIQARIDGDSVVIESHKEIVLKCGKASITLTKAGKILIKGTHLLNQSSGTNRIKGGSVQLN